MLLCWQNCPEERPTFKQLGAILRNILHTKTVSYSEYLFMRWSFGNIKSIEDFWLSLIAFASFIFVLEDLYQRWIFWRTSHGNWRGPFVRNDIQHFSLCQMTQTNWRPVNCLLLYVKLTISFLFAKKCNLIFNNHVKDTQGHRYSSPVLYDRGAWFLRVTMWGLSDLPCFRSVKKQKHDFHFSVPFNLYLKNC